jgi:predicted ABC-type ATPase
MSDWRLNPTHRDDNWQVEDPERTWELPGPPLIASLDSPARGTATNWNESKHPRRPNGQFGPKGANTPDGDNGTSTGGRSPKQLLDRITRAGHDTQTEYLARRGGDGRPVYKAQRRALHDRIRNKFLHGAKSVDDSPRVMFMAGGPASGKSSVMPLLDIPQGAVSLDADAVKGELPEYQEALRQGRKDGAALAHEESSDLVKDLQSHAAERGLNAIVDGVGNNAPGNLAGKMTQWKAQGYNVDLNVMTIPTDEAVRRAQKRAQRSGRHVPEKIIRKSHVGVSANWEAVQNLDWADTKLWDNDVAPGADPILVAHVPRGTTTPKVYDQARFNAFLAKADETV